MLRMLFDGHRLVGEVPWLPSPPVSHGCHGASVAGLASPRFWLSSSGDPSAAKIKDFCLANSGNEPQGIHLYL